MTRTYGQFLAKAMALDAQHGTEHHSDAVLCEMLNRIGRRARDDLPKPAPRATRVERKDRETEKTPMLLPIKARPVAASALLAKSWPAAAPTPEKPRRKPWSKAQVAAALQDGVLRGRISGTAAVAALKALNGGP